MDDSFIEKFTQVPKNNLIPRYASHPNIRPWKYIFVPNVVMGIEEDEILKSWVAERWGDEHRRWQLVHAYSIFVTNEYEIAFQFKLRWC
jgi:hypothetical protein